MGKKNMVMRRIAALLIASLVVTGSAFTSLADYYYLNEDQKKSTVELEVNGEPKTITVEYATSSNAGEGTATNSNALAKKVEWTSKNEKVATVKGNGFSASVAPVGAGTTTVEAEAEGKIIAFTVNVKDEDDKPATSSNTGSSSGGGGGSRRHVVGGGSSTNSYSMSGSWVMGANGWTFVKTDGQLATNTWGWINGQYYYFDANGNMMTGWQFINGKWYYLNSAEGSLQGAMLSGVLYDPAYNAYFYADASGAMVTGWYQVGANWYYFSPINDGVHVTGQLLAGTYVDGYYLGADGAWIPGN